tara:strand:+ start:68 stop:745 length:678 start_codon:yes stop_codon:yes gene_type:complete
MQHNLKQNIHNVINFYTNTHKVYGRGNDYLYSDCPNIEKRLIYILDKILVPFKKHPEFFIDKSVLDFGCGTGEHTYFLSNYVNTIDCFDPQIIHHNWLNSLFTSSNQIKVLKEEELVLKYYDTIFISGVLGCVYDYSTWLSNLIDTLNFKNLILVFVTDKDHSNINSGQSIRNTRLYDNLTYDTTICEKEVLKATSKLNLIDSCTYSTRQGDIHDHEKVIHFYKK